MVKDPQKFPRNILPKNIKNTPTSKSRSYRAASQRALLAKRMVADLIEMVKTRKTTKYIPKYPERICYCDKEKYGWTCTCTPGKAPCGCGPTVEVPDTIRPSTIRSYKQEIRHCRHIVKSMKLSIVNELNRYGDSELISIWSHLRLKKTPILIKR